MYLPQWVAGTLAILSGSSKVATWPTEEPVYFISKDGSDRRYLTVPSEEGAIPTLNKLKGKTPPDDGVWVLETVFMLPVHWVRHADSDLCLTAEYDEDKVLTEGVFLGECGRLDEEGNGAAWMAQTENGVTQLFLADHFQYRLAHNGDAVGVVPEGTEGWSFDWDMPDIPTD
ncbi:hypothetical protein CcaverHIS002_0500290 [Cutaneotrichosporon cavernicola]|uniref:Uncharacterized protein n=1 Tax=Cutaneotrichosporon cavernicola TaxID=279322 RepID=A0AA48QXP8_9TREE|nr:uncharacterized protein CcaverHIS019_0600290 [Cutaneotrichosporon cavernicola]BEI84628.1 hypothetical protein CcaverHIS002_0500290 [Cutaneotrichosporon cavernicola]BEI93570.1 hypothetical protein CcaverHIS019_0600290 [Cutaneotrichosporon cavernicola]BEJ01347.1 hypothetical protein CcaverHIS631_0600290 [Cutaneotrichosporon cavernicola]BEJ09114.1 hypothetical protein CcaverHIS641_0600290 [Cutaneotrichosporon cavernicola]